MALRRISLTAVGLLALFSVLTAARPVSAPTIDRYYAYLYATGTSGFGAQRKAMAVFTVVFPFCEPLSTTRIRDYLREQGGGQLANKIRERLGSGASVSYLISSHSSYDWAAQALARQARFYRNLKYEVHEGLQYSAGLYASGSSCR